MIPCSALFRDALRYSHNSFTEIDVVRGDVILGNDVKITAGDVTTDRTSNTRYSATIEIGLYPWDNLPIAVDGTRIRIRHGIDSIGRKESLQMGEYQVYDYKRTNRGTVSVTLKGLENVLIEDRFLAPRKPPYGMSTVKAIVALILQTNPSFIVNVQCTQDKRVTATALWDRERWDSITALANSIGAEVFAGHDGQFYIVDAPDVTNLVPVFTVDAGPNGVLIQQDKTSSREKVYNAVSVSGQSADTTGTTSTTPVPYGIAIDNDPASPTYFYGPYGKVPRFFSSQFFTSNSQCVAYARQLLGQSLASNNTLSVEAVPLPMLVAGDPILAILQDGEQQKHLLQSTKVALGSGSWGATTLSTLVPDDEGA